MTPIRYFIAAVLASIVLAALYVALWMRREPQAVTAFRDAEPVVSV